MLLNKQIIQYNGLVFSGFATVFEQDDEETSFKVEETEYTYGNGSYVAFKQRHPFVSAKNVGITIKLSTKRVQSSYKKYLKEFAKTELSRQGKLWAIDNGTLIWAYAYATSLSDAVEVGEDEIQISADFSLYEGVWHKANIYTTFIYSFDMCDFLSRYKFREPQTFCKIKPKYIDTDECCYNTTIRSALCNKDITKEKDFRISEDHALANELFGRVRGEAICSEDCGGIIARTFFCNTEVPTDDVKITIMGELSDPEVEINGNVNMYEGEYTNLVIYPNGEAKYLGDTSDCAIDPDNIVIGDNNTLGFTLQPRENHIVVRTGTDCKACVYIDVNGLVI